MADGEADPRPEPGSQDCDSPLDNHDNVNGVSNGYSSEEDNQEAPLDFSVARKEPSSIPIQNLNNKLTNKLANGQQRTNVPTWGYRETSPPPRDTASPEDRTVVKTESVSPPAGLSPGYNRTRVTSADSPGDKIGEPQLALPGMLPGALLPGAAAGLLPMIPPGLLPNGAGLFNGMSVPSDLKEAGNGKRPFKAYTKDQMALPGPFGALAGLPGGLPAGLPGLDVLTAQALTANSEEAFKQYKAYMALLQEQLYMAQKSPGGSSTSSSNAYSGGSHGVHSPEAAASSGGSATPTSTSLSKHSMSTTPSSTPTFVMPTSPESTVYTTSRQQSRKRGRQLPEDEKDGAYWERRRKNNEAAKRSRDSRRAKEDQIAIRAAFLEQENLKLRVEVTALKNETAKLRCMLYNS